MIHLHYAPEKAYPVSSEKYQNNGRKENKNRGDDD